MQCSNINVSFLPGSEPAKVRLYKGVVVKLNPLHVKNMPSL